MPHTLILQIDRGVLAFEFFPTGRRWHHSGAFRLQHCNAKKGSQPIDSANFPGQPEQISYSLETGGTHEAFCARVMAKGGKNHGIGYSSRGAGLQCDAGAIFTGIAPKVSERHLE